ncbi:hypothetical protein CBR_g55410 [Chara braunii]|uniref:Uncharacterized protein n=1 Tax=Chara braunii TaxID=69332 RepID=A0A388K7Q6_CHABU|nr:hypothetical protein CBR_g55410 [Chara braunii]|eukprot:GBG66067.1 hypothetical protein CBR_g55410 [Chara braunii]
MKRLFVRSGMLGEFAIHEEARMAPPRGARGMMKKTSRCNDVDLSFPSTKEQMLELAKLMDAADECGAGALNEKGCQRKDSVFAGKLLERLRQLSMPTRVPALWWMMDLMQPGGCTQDLETAREFEREEGLRVMLRALKLVQERGEEAQLIASTLAKFIPYLPHFSRGELDPTIVPFVDTFECLIVKMYKLIKPACDGEDETSAIHKPPDLGEGPGWISDVPVDCGLRLKEAGACSISSFAYAARCIVEQYGEVRGTQEDLPRGVIGRPYIWMLKVLNEAENILVLLDCALEILRSTPNALDLWQDMVRQNIVAACISTLSSVWSCKRYWQRFDKRLPLSGSPSPMASIKQLDVSDVIEEKLKAVVHLLRKLDEVPPLVACSMLHLAKIFLSQKIPDMDEDIAEILLQCLCYWRHALGQQELQWFACEVIETLRDLFATTKHRTGVRGRICNSPGGVQCLRLMLCGAVSPTRSVGFRSSGGDEEHERDHEGNPSFEQHLSQMLSALSGGQEKAWCANEAVECDRCAVSAAGLLADLYWEAEGAKSAFVLPSIDRELFLDNLHKSLTRMLVRVETDIASPGLGSSSISSWIRPKAALEYLTSRLVGKMPTRRSGPESRLSRTWQFRKYQPRVNALLGVIHTTRILEGVMKSGVDVSVLDPKRYVRTVLIPRLDKLVHYNPLRIAELNLPELQKQWEKHVHSFLAFKQHLQWMDCNQLDSLNLRAPYEVTDGHVILFDLLRSVQWLDKLPRLVQRLLEADLPNHSNFDRAWWAIAVAGAIWGVIVISIGQEGKED